MRFLFFKFQICWLLLPCFVTAQVQLQDYIAVPGSHKFIETSGEPDKRTVDTKVRKLPNGGTEITLSIVTYLSGGSSETTVETLYLSQDGSEAWLKLFTRDSKPSSESFKPYLLIKRPAKGQATVQYVSGRNQEQAHQVKLGPAVVNGATLVDCLIWSYSIVLPNGGIFTNTHIFEKGKGLVQIQLKVEGGTQTGGFTFVREGIGSSVNLTTVRTFAQELGIQADRNEYVKAFVIRAFQAGGYPVYSVAQSAEYLAQLHEFEGYRKAISKAFYQMALGMGGSVEDALRSAGISSGTAAEMGPIIHNDTKQ